MIVRTIAIAREGDFGYGAANLTKPFLAKIQVEGQHGKTELYLSPEMSRRIIEIVAEEVAAAGRATAEAMTAEALSFAVLPAPEPEPAP